MTSKALIPLALAAAFAAVGCATPPPAPEPPTVSLSGARFDAAEPAGFGVEAVTADWWLAFDDPRLTTLVEAALEHNTQLGVAQANLRTAEVLLAAERLARTPSTLTTASAEAARAAREDADVDLSATGQLGASWEYDAFGRIAALVESAEFNLEAQREARRDLAVIVAAETALAYADLRGNQVRLAVARSNAALQKDSLDLLQTLFENGRATRLDVELAESQYRTTLASLPQLESRMRIAGAQLVTLTGNVSLDDIPVVAEALEAPGEIPSPPSVISVETPETLIRRRPDIREAEAAIAQELALGEAERARLFPTLTFSADLTALFNDDNDLGDSFGFGIGPAIRWDGPDLRRVRADIDLADARTREAFATYEQRVVEAIGEVETALIGYLFEQRRRADLEAAAASADRAAELARLRFEEGVDDFLDVIEAQRSLLDAEDRLETSRLETTRQAILAYRALGGIWSSERLDAADLQGDDPNG